MTSGPVNRVATSSVQDPVTPAAHAVLPDTLLFAVGFQGRARAAVDLAAREDEAPPLGAVDDGVDDGVGVGVIDGESLADSRTPLSTAATEPMVAASL